MTFLLCLPPLQPPNIANIPPSRLPVTMPALRALSLHFLRLLAIYLFRRLQSFTTIFPLHKATILPRRPKSPLICTNPVATPRIASSKRPADIGHFASVQTDIQTFPRSSRSFYQPPMRCAVFGHFPLVMINKLSVSRYQSWSSVPLARRTCLFQRPRPPMYRAPRPFSCSAFSLLLASP